MRDGVSSRVWSVSALISRLRSRSHTSRVLSRSRTRGKRIPYISITTLVFVFALPLAPPRAAPAAAPCARAVAVRRGVAARAGRVRSVVGAKNMYYDLCFCRFCGRACLQQTTHTVLARWQGDRRSGQCGESSRAPPSVDGLGASRPVRPDWTLRGQTMSCDCLWTQTQTRLTGVQATRLTMRQNPGGDCH